MRKVLYKKWIPIQYAPVENGSRAKIHGTGKWEDDFINEGLFHQWGVSYEEMVEGTGNYNVAIIENADGTISEVLPSNMKFIS